MKKIVSIVLAMCMLASLCAMPALAQEAVAMTKVQTKDIIAIMVDGNYVDCAQYGQMPVIVEGRTLVPLRSVFEALGATVEWNNSARSVTSVKGDVTITLAIDSKEMTVNGAVKTLDVPAQIMNDRTMVPVRAVAEAFGCNVEWDNKARAVIITTIPDTPEKVTEKAIDAILNFNIEEGLKYFENPEPSLDINELSDEDRELFKELYLEIANLIDYEITGCEINGDEAIVTVTTSVPDVDTDLSDEEAEAIFNKVLQSYGYTEEEVYADSDKLNEVYEATTLETINYILERMAETAPEKEKITETDTFTLVKKNNKWLID